MVKVQKLSAAVLLAGTALLMGLSCTSEEKGLVKYKSVDEARAAANGRLVVVDFYSET